MLVPHGTMPCFMIFKRILDLQELKNQVARPERLKTCFFYSVLKEKMVLWREMMVLELLEHLSTVNMQLYECRVKIWNYSGFVWHFYALIEFLGI